MGDGRGAEQRSARQLCATNLWHTRIVRDNCALQTCGAHCVPEQCATTVRCILAPEKKFAYEKRVCSKLAATMSRKLAAILLQVCGIWYVPETLYFGKGNVCQVSRELFYFVSIKASGSKCWPCVHNIKQNTCMLVNMANKENNSSRLYETQQVNSQNGVCTKSGRYNKLVQRWQCNWQGGCRWDLFCTKNRWGLLYQRTWDPCKVCKYSSNL